MNLLILSMIATDAYLLYKGCCGAGATLTPQLFFAKLAAEMIDLYKPDEEGTSRSIADTRRKRHLSDRCRLVSQRITRRKRSKGVGSFQSRCIQCKHKHTSYVCTRCLALHPQGKDVFVCWEDSLHQQDLTVICWKKHLVHCHDE